MAAPGIARRALRSWLVALACADELVEDAALVVSETVTNAVVHARSAPRLRVSIVDDRLRVEVHDTSPARPVLRAPSAVTGGQGLRIVTAVAQECGWMATSTGKVVWTELRLVDLPFGPAEGPINPAVSD